MTDVTHQTSLSTTAAALAEMWRDLLGVSQVDADDDFFEIGGTSLSAIKLLQRVEKKFGLGALSPEALYENPELGDMAAAIDESVGRSA